MGLSEVRAMMAEHGPAFGGDPEELERILQASLEQVRDLREAAPEGVTPSVVFAASAKIVIAAMESWLRSHEARR